MNDMLISINVDEKAIENLIKENVEYKLSEFKREKVFLTMNDLEYITGCSEGYIKNNFFYDVRFSKIRRKVGRKWLFPAEETKEFLLQWLKEQPNE